MERKIYFQIRKHGTHTSAALLALSFFCLLNCALAAQINTALPPVIDGVDYTPGNWQTDLPAGQKGVSKGNHRVVITVPKNAPAILAHIPWRRGDLNPLAKGTVLVDAGSGIEIKNKVLFNVSNESVDLIFEPVHSSEKYFLYYMPYETTGGYYPKVNYIPPASTAEDGWLRVHKLGTSEIPAGLPKAEVVAIQSIDTFHSFYPMEVIATASETTRFLSTGRRDFYLFPEDRALPIRMQQFLPVHWVRRGHQDFFRGEAKQGEYFTFQIGVYADKVPLENVAVSFTDFFGSGDKIPAQEFTCFNVGGTDLAGQPFAKNISVEAGRVQALWMGVAIPPDIAPGNYAGQVRVSAEGVAPQSVQVHVQVEDETIVAMGDNAPRTMSRLRWLNSTIGTDPDFIISPYDPVTFSGKTLRILGREIELGADGLPVQISSFFTREMTGLSDVSQPILAQPVSFEILTESEKLVWHSDPFEIESAAKSEAHWQVHSSVGPLDVEISGRLEYEGMLNYKILFVAREDAKMTDIRLPIMLEPDAAKYILGLGKTGQQRPSVLNWKWDVKKHQEGVWLGNVNKGLQAVLRDETYERPLNTNFYQSKPLRLPKSWYNQGRGGIRIRTEPSRVVVENYSGARTMKAGDSLYFNIRFLITPFKYLDTKTHFNTRFVHKYVPVDSVREWGGTVVNIHHANEINPYINYPFFALEKQSAYITKAHQQGIKVKLYNTIRELSYKSHELFALRSLGTEIFNDGEGGGHPWLQEHLGTGYHKAWHAWRVDDAAILNKGTSRWTNYYIEGLNWLAGNQHIDGLYLDDIAFSRETVKRMVSVLHKQRQEVVIDLHSANQFNDRDGFINSAFLYMEHLPYISRLWFGEYFDYNRDENYWMTEVAGIPFGLMGEMLQDGGHPWRGMLFGMTTRFYHEYDPRPIWKLFDTFGIAESRMLGYWLEDSPVKSTVEGILATTYVRQKKALIALASWVDDDVDLRLQIAWKKLGIAVPGRVTATAPEIAGLQKQASVDIGRPVAIKKNAGRFILLEWD